MKKFLTLALVALLLMLAMLLSACSDTLASGNPAVKTGLYMMTSFGKSAAATAEKDGSAQADIVLVAVTVTDEGVIDKCVIDTVQAKVGFNTEGALTTDLAATFDSKNVLGDAYGMKKASSIGKEWYEQAAALAAYVEGKTLAEVLAIPVDSNGKAMDADILSSATVSIDGYLAAITQAVKNAAHEGARKGDTLKLESVTSIAKSKDAAEDKDGLAQAYATVAAVTLGHDNVITSCVLDAVQANVNFNAKGGITSDLGATVLTKVQLGDGYGMRAASSLGKEWFEQAAAFADAVTGKTIAQATDMQVEDGKAVDLVSSVTIGVNDFLKLLAMAGA